MNTGEAGLHIAQVRGRSTVISSWARSPMALLTPRARGGSVWAYTTSFGGGMVAGDETRLDLKIDPGARCFLGTQASTKIYRNPNGQPCSHRLAVSLAAGSLLAMAPDPVQCFSDSSFDQQQTFQLASDANLVVVDWVSAGRLARGERWAFRRYSSRNRIVRGGRLLLLDSILLEGGSEPMNNPFRTGRFNCLATLLIFGLNLRNQTAELLARIGQRPVERGASLILSASPVEEGAVLRIAGLRVEDVGHALHHHLGFLPALIEGDPWTRKW